MARNRMVKVEFWDDEKLSTISRDARLLFIGLWTYSDDYGVVKGHPVWLKSKIFPYDNIDLQTFQSWLDDLSEIQSIQPFNRDGESYIYIKNFTKHQVITRPSKSQNPQPDFTSLTEGSLSTHGGLSDEREVKEKEKEKLNTCTNVHVSADPADAQPSNPDSDEKTGEQIDPPTNPSENCPQKQIVVLYHEILPTHPTVRLWGTKNQGYLSARWKSDPEFQSLDWWESFFRRVGASDFLTGKTKQEFMPDLEWLIKQSNFAKILNGRYDNRNGNPLKGKVSDVTARNIQTFQNWEPPVEGKEIFS